MLEPWQVQSFSCHSVMIDLSRKYHSTLSLYNTSYLYLLSPCRVKKFRTRFASSGNVVPLFFAEFSHGWFFRLRYHGISISLSFHDISEGNKNPAHISFALDHSPLRVVTGPDFTGRRYFPSLERDKNAMKRDSNRATFARQG